jgi:glycosyltransferase involved in cell wall biosynthesis
MTQIIEQLPSANYWVATQATTPVNTRWQQSGCKVEVWNLPYKVGESFKKNGLPGRFERLWSLLKTNWRTFRLVRSNLIDLIVCNDPSALWHSVFGARLAGGKVVFNVRDTKGPGEPANRFRWLTAFRISNRQVVLSRSMKEFWAKHLFGKNWEQHRLAKKIRHIYSIVDFSKMHPVTAEEKARLRQSLGIPQDTFAIAHVATFNAKKGQLAFLQKAAPQLLVEPNSIRLYFVGDFDPERNPYASRCREAASAQHLEKAVEFRGYTEAVSDYYKASDLIILFSQKEGLARSMIEGLSCGVPVISFDVCSAREILEGQDCGAVVPLGDFPALAAAINRVSKTEDQLARWSNNASRATRALFDSKAVIQGYLDVYSDVLSDRMGVASAASKGRSEKLGNYTAA